MKSILHSTIIIFVCLTGLTSLKLSSQGNNSHSAWTKKFGYQKAFIENKGQFNIPASFGNPSPIIFAVDQGGTKIYFTKTGITYALLETTKKPKDAREIERERREEFRSPDEHMRHEKEEHALKVKEDQVTMIWQNANPGVKIEGGELTADHHSYSFKEANGVIKNVTNVKGFRKITYKNIYPNIDIDYVFSEKGGLKYSLTLHPGADPSLVKMAYNSHVSLKNNGDIHIDTKFGNIIDHAPLTFYDQNSSSVISSAFIKTGNTVSFQLSNYDHSKTIVIDPWVQTPVFTSNWDCVWECEKDASGNVYIIGGVNPMQLLKYNSAGAIQWTYNTPYDTTAWLGTLATDNAGNSYITQGSLAKITKVNTTGALVWNNNGSTSPNNSDEYWSIAFNCDQTKLIVGGTTGSFSSPPALKGAIFDIDINTGVPTNTQVIAYGSMTSFPPSIQEVRSITAGKNGKYYFLTLDTIGYISQNFQNCTNSTATLYKAQSTYSLNYKCENFRYNNSGIEAICANEHFLYTQNGTHVHKRSLATGAILDTALIPGGVSSISTGKYNVENSGIDIDDCGNVYVGSKNALIKYDSNLNLLAQVSVAYNVYDVQVTTNGDVIVCGSTGNASNPTRTGYIEVINMNACSTLTYTCCDASICTTKNYCLSDSATTLQPTTSGGSWSGPGITNTTMGTFDPSIAGTGLHTIKYNLSCGMDSVVISVQACTNVSVCVSSGSLTAFGGSGNYNWASTTSTLNCSGCPFGTCGPFCPGIPVPTWTASGITVAAPSASVFPIKVKDMSSGTTFTFTSLSSLPACTVTDLAAHQHLNDHVLVYPNPNNGEFNIDYAFVMEGQEIILIDMLGKEVKRFILENNKGLKILNVSDLSNGIYSYKIQNKQHILLTGKISINK